MFNIATIIETFEHSFQQLQTFVLLFIVSNQNYHIVKSIINNNYDDIKLYTLTSSYKVSFRHSETISLKLPLTC